MHYRVVASKDVFATEPSLKAIPEFNACTSQELKFIFLAYDYEGPFKKLERSKRLKEAAIAAKYEFQEGQGIFKKDGIDAITFRKVRMQKARAYFMEKIQANDLDLEMLESYNEQIREYNVFLAKKDKKPAETKLAITIQEKLPNIVKLRNELAEICGHKADYHKELGEDTKMSTIDKVNAGLLMLPK